MNQPQVPPSVPAPPGAPLPGGRPAPGGYGAPSGYPVPGAYGTPTPPPRRSPGLVAGLVVASVLVLALVASTVTFGVLWSGAEGRADDARAELATVQRAAADDATATRTAATYAAGASSFDYRNLAPWHTALVKGVSPELKTRLESTAGAMDQLLQPMQWVSTGTVVDSVVNARSGSVYKVNVYVKVSATSAQKVEPSVNLAQYAVTLDQSKDWQITDVGGVTPGR
ncbi:hypothetical protein ACXYTP_05780 [Tsukamurella ocularis]